VTALLQEANEELQLVRDQLEENSVRSDRIQAAKVSVESRLNELQHDFDLRVRDLALVKQDNDDITSKLKAEAKLRSDLERKVELSNDARKAAEDKGEAQAEEIRSLRISLEAQQNIIGEYESKISGYEEDLEGANKLYDRYSEMETLLGEIMEEKKELEARESDLVQKCRMKDELIAELRNEVDPLQERTQTYKEKYEALVAMIEPFKEQLESFEMEKAALLNQNQEAKGEVKKLSAQVSYTSLPSKLTTLRRVLKSRSDPIFSGQVLRYVIGIYQGPSSEVNSLELVST